MVEHTAYNCAEFYVMKIHDIKGSTLQVLLWTYKFLGRNYLKVLILLLLYFCIFMILQRYRRQEKDGLIITMDVSLHFKLSFYSFLKAIYYNNSNSNY